VLENVILPMKIAGVERRAAVSARLSVPPRVQGKEVCAVGTDKVDPLRALSEAHATSLWRYVVSLTGDAAGADDVVQETLVRAWRTPRILADPVDSTRAWLFTVARHLVVDEARSARRRHEITTDEVPDRAERDKTDAVFEALLVEEALAGLGHEHRSVLVHCYRSRALRPRLPPLTTSSPRRAAPSGRSSSTATG
jgi:RNA polymerase sigma-70 factor (ECF subfamily)